MKLPVLCAAGGAPWEARLVVDLERGEHPVTVVRRCVDIVDLLAVALSGQARAALVAESLRRLDADAVDRLIAAGVALVAVVRRDDTTAEDRVRALGISHVVPDDAAAAVVATVIGDAVAVRDAAAKGTHAARGFGDPLVSQSAAIASDSSPSTDGAPSTRGSVVAVWGPTGAPGRTTVAVTLADELSRLGSSSLLVDADVYGGVVAAVLGLLDESPGFAAACRQSTASRLDPEALADLCWAVTPSFRVLTGVTRSERWPELRATAVEPVLAAARSIADYTVVDCGFCLESDEELSFDTMAPRRNGATLAVLDAADVILAVGSADPIGVQRLVRGLSELRDAEVAAPLWVVLNKVRRAVVPGDPAAELIAALDRFAGRTPAALLPSDQASLDAALVAGKTLGDVRPASPLRQSIITLAGALAGISVPRHRRAARSRR
jgi:MinD-like ATPase involved in chromosome partitioning or flagellar assembly